MILFLQINKKIVTLLNEKIKQTKKNLKKISKIHDRFFKQIFSYQKVMRVFIQQTFPEYIIRILNLNTLANDTNSYIDEKLKENFSDLVYTCNSRNNVELKIALLFEHKSYVVDFPHFQIMKYLERIGESCEKENNKRIFVLPIIFYHGDNKWIKRELYEYYENLDEELRRFVPSFDYILIDISQIPDETIQKYELYELQISIFLFKYIFNKEELKQKFDIFFEKNKQLTKNEETFMVTFLEYLRNNLNQNEMETVYEKVKDYTTSDGNIFVQNYNRRYLKKGINKGIKKGRQEGRQEAIEKAIENAIQIGKYNLSEIAEIFNVTIDFVLDIKNKIAKK